MLRRALPIVLAAVVIAPALAQNPAQRGTQVVSPANPQRAVAGQAPAGYFPERLDWQHKKPEEVGMNPALVNEAVQLAIAAETPGPKDMALYLHNSLGTEPYSTSSGPIMLRGGAADLSMPTGSYFAESS